MIENSALTISNTGSALQSVSIDNHLLNTLVIASLTTIIAYQGKAFFFDLALGLKRRGVMKISDLHIFLLSGTSSPFAVLDALLRNDWLTRKRLRGDLPQDTIISREKKRIGLGARSKLLFLLVIGPIVNIVAVSLTLENEKVLTIGEAGLGGFELGIVPSLERIRTEPDSQFCEKVPIDFKDSEQALSTFFLCRNTVFAKDTDDGVPPGQAVVRAGLLPPGIIVMSIHSDEDLVAIALHGDLRFNATVYYIKATMTMDELILLTDLGAVVVRRACGAAGIESPSLSKERVRVERVIECPNGLPGDDRIEGLVQMRSVITFKEAPSLQIVRFLDIPLNEDPEEFPTPYFSAESLPLLSRRRGRASILILLFIAVSIVVLRVFTKLFAHNDLPIAIEVVLRDRFGLHCCDSMLQNDTQVEYRKSFQLVENAHYGMSSDSLPEVDRFVGGSVQ